jgi:sugar phosphate isomerase/epimerase
MITRRESLKLVGLAAAASVVPLSSGAATQKNKSSSFVYCLNTSTIRGQGQGLVETIEIASKAGYDGIELWVNDVRAYLEKGNTLAQLRQIIKSNSLVVEGAIAHSTWMANDSTERNKGFVQMEDDMSMMAELECKRIAAPPSGFIGSEIDYLKVGEYFRQLIVMGRKTGVMPQLEFQGSKPVLYHFGQALLVAAATNDPDVRILGDVYHMFKGGSGFNCLKMIGGDIMEMIHLNDYPGDIPKEEQNDSNRVYPGDGAAPMKEIISDLRMMGGTKVLSLELFNRDYWKQDALLVAKTRLQKMKGVVQASR